jgi:hypothetical protein
VAKRRGGLLARIWGGLFGDLDRLEREERAAYERRRRREQKAGIRQHKVGERAHTRKQRSEARQQRERERREALGARRSEAAMEARLARQALRDHERAVKGYMSAGLTRAEAEQMAGRFNPRRRRRATRGR